MIDKSFVLCFVLFFCLPRFSLPSLKMRCIFVYVWFLSELKNSFNTFFSTSLPPISLVHFLSFPFLSLFGVVDMKANTLILHHPTPSFTSKSWMRNREREMMVAMWHDLMRYIECKELLWAHRIFINSL